MNVPIEVPWIMVGIIGLLVLVVIAYNFLRAATHIVPEGQRVVIYRLGRFDRIAGPGQVWVIPGVDQVVQTLEVRDHPIEITVPGIFAFGIANDLTFNLWLSYNPEQAASGDKDRLAKLVQINDTERRRQIEVKLREALVNQIAELEKRMPLPGTPNAIDGVIALAPGSKRYNELLAGFKRELEKTLPLVGVILNTNQSITVTGRGIPEGVINTVKRIQERQIDSQWLTRYLDQLRRQFPDISDTVLIRMLTLIKEGDIERFQALLSERQPVPEETAEPSQNFRNPYITGLPVINPEMFFGRTDILQKIIRRLHNDSFAVIGLRRIGKTTLLYQLKSHLTSLDDPEYYFVPIFIDMQGIPEPNFFHAVMNGIVTGLSQYLSTDVTPALDFAITRTNYSDSAFDRDIGKIIKALQQSQPGKEVKLTLLMDEMDVLNSYDQRIQSQLRSIFIHFTQNLRVVATGVNLDQEWKRHESPFYNMLTFLPLGPLSPEEAQQLIVKPVKDRLFYDDEAIARILAATEGHPFRLQQLCSEIIGRMVEEKRKRVTLADVEAILAHIKWTEEGTKKLDNETLTQPVLIVPPVLAEKRAPYNISTPPEEKTK